MPPPAARPAAGRASIATITARPPDDLLIRRDDVRTVVRRTVLVALALVAASRSWHLVGRGRFWAEEGTQYFAHMSATSGPWGLWYAQTRAGYTNVFANLATWLAGIVPLRVAPLVTVWSSFAVLLVVVWVALAWPSELLPTARSRVAVAVVLVVGTLALPEVWLNSINAQAYLALLTVLLLFVRVDALSRRRVVVGAGLLALAGLSGFYALALAPVFVVAAWRDGGKRRWAFAGVLCTTAAIQVAIYLSALGAGLLNTKRSLVPGLGDALRGLAWQLTGLAVPFRNTAGLIGSQQKGASPIVLLLIAGAVAALLIAILRCTTRRLALGLAASFVIIELLVQAGALSGVAAGRYAVVPIGIMTLALVHGAAVASRRWVRRLAEVGVVAVCVAGLSQFWTLEPTTLRCLDCPVWADEVERWERGEIDRLEIWPYDRKEPWTVKLIRDASSSSGPGR